MSHHRLDIYPGGRKRSEWPITLFAIRKPGLLAFGILGRGRSLGVNLHRDGGISFSGAPQRGGTSFMLRGSPMHRRVEQLARDCRHGALGPIAVCSGRDF